MLRPHSVLPLVSFCITPSCCAFVAQPEAHFTVAAHLAVCSHLPSCKGHSQYHHHIGPRIGRRQYPRYHSADARYQYHSLPNASVYGAVVVASYCRFSPDSFDEWFPLFSTAIHTHHCHLLLLLSPNTDTHFTVSQFLSNVLTVSGVLVMQSS